MRRAVALILPRVHFSPAPAVAGFLFTCLLPSLTPPQLNMDTNSDLQALVMRFEHLNVRDRDAESAERTKRHAAELRRAQIGREEAENDVARLREETRRLKKEADESRDRERILGKRLDVVAVCSRAAALTSTTS